MAYCTDIFLHVMYCYNFSLTADILSLIKYCFIIFFVYCISYNWHFCMRTGLVFICINLQNGITVRDKGTLQTKYSTLPYDSIIPQLVVVLEKHPIQLRSSFDSVHVYIHKNKTWPDY